MGLLDIHSAYKNIKTL